MHGDGHGRAAGDLDEQVGPGVGAQPERRVEGGVGVGRVGDEGEQPGVLARGEALAVGQHHHPPAVTGQAPRLHGGPLDGTHRGALDRVEGQGLEVAGHTSRVSRPVSTS